MNPRDCVCRVGRGNTAASPRCLQAPEHARQSIELDRLQPIVDRRFGPAPRGLYRRIYYGLWYPILVAVMTFIVGVLFLRETKDTDIVAGSAQARMAV